MRSTTTRAAGHLLEYVVSMLKRVPFTEPPARLLASPLPTPPPRPPAFRAAPFSGVGAVCPLLLLAEVAPFFLEFHAFLHHLLRVLVQCLFRLLLQLEELV